MKSAVCITIFLCVIGIIKIGDSQDKSENTANDDYYKNILLELGAFPYLFEKGHPCYPWKGNQFRIDINGWLSPYIPNHILENIDINAEEKTKYGYPPTKDRILGWYKKYKYMLDVEEYQKGRGAQYQIIIYLLLEIMIEENIPVENFLKLINLLKLKPGHEDMIIRLLSDKISMDEAFDIFLSIGDVIEKKIHLLDELFPKIKKNNSDFISKLNEFIENKENPFYFRWFLLYKLYEMDMDVYRKKFISVSVFKVLSENNYVKRASMYRTMLKSKEDEIFKSIYKYIERDPDTFCRFTILMNLDYIDDNIIKVIKKIADGKGNYWHYCDRDLMKMEPTRWQDSLKFYINSMMEKVNNKKVLSKLGVIRAKLDKVRIRKMEEMDWYFNYFKIKEKKRNINNLFY